MGKILDYNNLGAPPADNDLLFMGDYSDDTGNPTTMRLTISDLNKKRNVDAADSSGLKLRDDSGTYGIFIKDGGNVGIGTNTPDYKLDLETAAVGTSNLRIYSNVINGYPHLVMKNDAATWSIYAPHGSFTGAGVADLFSIYNGSSHVLIIQTDGNVGIGVTPTTSGSTKVNYPLEVVGKLAATGTNDVIIDPATGEVKSQSGLHLEKSAGQDVYVVGDSSAAAIYAKSSDKTVGINYVSAPGARLHIYEGASGTATNLKLQTYQSSGTVRTIQQFTHTVGATHQHQYLVWDGSELGINNDGLALGSASVNFAGSATHGKIGINASVGTRVLEATETSSPGIVAAFKSTAGGKGSKILLTNSVDAASVNQSQGLGFSTMLGSTETVTWFGGTFRPSGGANNYFALNYVGATFAADSQYAIDTTLTNNEMYLDSSGNVTFKGNVAGDAFYDKGGTTVGNYCRGRFVQTFSFPYFFETVNQRWSPLFAGPYDTTNNYHGSNAPDKQFASLAPMGGRVTRIDVSLNMTTPSNVVKAYIYTGSSMPAAASNQQLTSSNSAYKQDVDCSSASSNSFTLGFDDFAASASTGGQANLDFSQGEFLMLAMDTNTGNGYCNVTVTVEFDVPDSLGA